jgi:hypothetical protein
MEKRDLKKELEILEKEMLKNDFDYPISTVLI